MSRPWPIEAGRACVVLAYNCHVGLKHFARLCNTPQSAEPHAN